MDILQHFKTPPRIYSPVPLWFWNGEPELEKLQWQIDEMVDKGVYGAFMHPRANLRTPYLEEEWWRLIDGCLERGREKGFQPWLYDEYAWPSGTAGSTFDYSYQKPSRVLAEGEQNMAKGLYTRTYKLETKESIQTVLAQEEQLPLALYWLEGEDAELRIERIDLGCEVSLTGKSGAVMAFYRRVYPKAVDYLNKETIRSFIAYTHEEYSKRYRNQFGTFIPGIYFDEIYMAAHPLPWTDNLPEQFQARCGYDLLDHLPWLMEEGHADARKVRRDYYNVIGQLYEEAFFRQIADWCEEHQLMMTGHTEESLHEHPRRQGNYFETMRHLQIPGSDNHDYRYRFPRQITYCESKYAVSVARAYGKPRSMTEAMGGAGWGCSLQQFKRGINVMGAMGINLFTLHGFYYESERMGSQSDWPTSFFYQNPYWKYFKTFADYISRISYMNTIGRPIVENGLFYPIEEIQANTVGGEVNERGRKLDQAFHEALDSLLERQIDVDMIDEHSLLQADLSGGRVQIGLQAFSVILLPAGAELSQPLLERLTDFRRAGGKVVLYNTGEDKESSSSFNGDFTCTARQLPEVLNRMQTPDVYIANGHLSKIYVNHRMTDKGKDYYFVVNGTERDHLFTLQLRSIGAVQRLNPETGKAESIAYRWTGKATELSLMLEADEACYLLFDQTEQDLTVSQQSEDNAMCMAVPGRWTFLPMEEQYDYRWEIDATSTELAIPLALLSSDLHEESQLIRICNSAEEEGRCDRHLSLWRSAWITRRASWHDDSIERDLYFRKKLILPVRPEYAKFNIVAINEYTLYINEELVTRQTSNGQPTFVDVSDYLSEGTNLIAVHVHNETPAHEVNFYSIDAIPQQLLISLLLQGEIVADGENIDFLSDASWIVSNREHEGWASSSMDFERTARKVRADQYQSFGAGEPTGTWLQAWERGQPPVQPWGDLPLFGRYLAYPLRLSYSVTLPAGTVRIKEPKVSGEYQCMLDGRTVSWDHGEIRLALDGRMHHLDIQVTVTNGSDGLKRPVEVTIAPFDSVLGDWRLHGLQWFSGRAYYRNTLSIQRKTGKYTLDLGKVCFSAEIWVNGVLAGTRIWSPYKMDISNYVQDGVNELVIVIANSAANERRNSLVDEGMAFGWSRYWNEDNIDREGENLVSGLLGPVRIYHQIPQQQQ